MSVKLFILGRPGTGKSTAARYITNYARSIGWTAFHLNDYQILKQMFQEDIEHIKFRPTKNNGFDVLDFSVLDIALKVLERQVSASISAKKNEIITIEFARDDYHKALKLFDPDFLRDSHFLFLDADMDICIQRIYDRVAHPTSPDDLFISDEILKTYYSMDNRLYMAYRLKKDFRIEKCVKTILNTDSRWDFNQQVFDFVSDIFKLEAPTQQKVSSIVTASKAPMHRTPALATVITR